jgi:hypothetical protein
LPFGIHSALGLAAVMAIGLSADAWTEQVIPRSGSSDVVTPSDVLARPESFLDSDIRVRGRIHLVRQDNLGPAAPPTGASSNSATSASLQLVTVGEPPGTPATLDLYRTGAQGVAEPVGCKAIAANQFDCDAFTPDAVTVVSGRLSKHRIPTQQVGSSAGDIRVLKYREIYVLLVRP